MDNYGLVKVRCKYMSCDDKPKFKCFGNHNGDYVACGGLTVGRWVGWTFYLINKKHLIEVKDERQGYS